jgi:hypothetical protein
MIIRSDLPDRSGDSSLLVALRNNATEISQIVEDERVCRWIFNHNTSRVKAGSVNHFSSILRSKCYLVSLRETSRIRVSWHGSSRSPDAPRYSTPPLGSIMASGRLCFAAPVPTKWWDGGTSYGSRNLCSWAYSQGATISCSGDGIFDNVTLSSQFWPSLAFHSTKRYGKSCCPHTVRRRHDGFDAKRMGGLEGSRSA